MHELDFQIVLGRKISERKNLNVPEFKEIKFQQKEIEKDLEIKKEELIKEKIFLKAYSNG